MALFFDGKWFDARLMALDLGRQALADSALIALSDVTLIFKDQMEVTGPQVLAWAALLGEEPSEIARRCGVSTPFERVFSDKDRIAALEARVAALEAWIRATPDQCESH